MIQRTPVSHVPATASCPEAFKGASCTCSFDATQDNLRSKELCLVHARVLINTNNALVGMICHH